MHGYFIYILDYNPLLPYLFFAQVTPALVTGSSFSCFLCPFDIPSFFHFFLALPYFLALEDAPGLFCIFLPQLTEPSLQGILVPFGIRNLHLGVGQGEEMSEGIPRHWLLPSAENQLTIRKVTVLWQQVSNGALMMLVGPYMFPERRTPK